MKILVAIPKPPDNQPEMQGRWRSAVQAAKDKMAMNTALSDVEWLGEGSILVLSALGLPAIGYMFYHADDKKLPYRVLVLHESADWKYEPPKTS